MLGNTNLFESEGRAHAHRISERMSTPGNTIMCTTKVKYISKVRYYTSTIDVQHGMLDRMIALPAENSDHMFCTCHGYETSTSKDLHSQGTKYKIAVNHQSISKQVIVQNAMCLVLLSEQ